MRGDYTTAPVFRGDFYTDDVLPPQRRERGTTYWRYHNGKSMMYYCPDDPLDDTNRAFCAHHRRHPNRSVEDD